MGKISFSFDNHGDGVWETHEASFTGDLDDKWEDIADDWFVEMEFTYGTIDTCGGDDWLMQSHEIDLEDRPLVLAEIKSAMLPYGVVVGDWVQVKGV